MRKGIIAIIVCAIILLFPLTINAADITNEREYKPLDLVVVIDASGSMNNADPERAVLSAVRMVANMMPAEDSRIGVISFNTDVNVLTRDSSNKPALLPLIEYSNLENVRTNVAGVVYEHYTAIGNALYEATKLLSEKSDDSRERVIMLFGDGMTELATEAKELECNNNESKAIQWARDNNCRIYCAGYDYVYNGISSMGANGEGLSKFTNIAGATGGLFAQCEKMSDAEQWFINFLADAIDLLYVEKDKFPGDGGAHESDIPISPSVTEMNIRISYKDRSQITDDSITLVDPKGNVVQLVNKDSVRFDIDATAASIKIIRPLAGTWKLKVHGITGDEIKIGVLEHYKMNLTTQFEFPDEHPGVAYAGDTIKVNAWLTYNGEVLTDPELYSSVKKAEATFVSRADADNPKVITLSQVEPNRFSGDFTVSKDSYYDVLIRLDWDAVYRENTMTIQSSNKALELVRDINDVVVIKGRDLYIDNLAAYTQDFENDSIEPSVSTVLDPDVADVKLVKDRLVISGKKMSSTLVTVKFTDAQHNIVSTTFKVTVLNLWFLIGMIAIIFGIFLFLTLGVIFAVKRAIFMSGRMTVKKIAYEVKEVNDTLCETVIYENGQSLQDLGTGVPSVGSPANTAAPTFGAFSKGAFGEVASIGNVPSAPTGAFGGALGDAPPASAFVPSSIPSVPTGAFGGGAAVPPGVEIPQAPQTVAPVIPLVHDYSSDDDKMHVQFCASDSSSVKMGALSRKNTALWSVVERFSQTYQQFMTANNTITSLRASDVQGFAERAFSELKKVSVKGSLLGRKGIEFNFKKVIPDVKVHPELDKKGRIRMLKDVTLKVSCPLDDGNAVLVIQYQRT